MEIILALLVLITFFLPWVNYFAIRRLRKDLEALQHKDTTMPAAMKPAPHIYEPRIPDPAAAPTPLLETHKVWAEPSPVVSEPAPMQLPTQAPPRVPRVEKEKKANGLSFEQNIGTKISVWLGAIALIFAAFYMVKYSIDQGFLSPGVRLVLSGLFGASLIAGGQWLAVRKHIANAERIAQALVGSGIVTLYVCLYAALNLYSLISPTAAFVAMAVVTGIAVIMSLRHGQPIALFGIIGGLLTPMMVGSENPSIEMLLTYLFLLYGGIVFILARMGWWTLAILMLGGILVWPCLWILGAFDALAYKAVVLYACAICAVSLMATARAIRHVKSPRYLHVFNVIAVLGTAAIISAIGLKIELALFDWAMLSVISLGVVGLVFFRPETYKNILIAKLLLDIALFSFWIEGKPHEDIMMVVAMLGAVYAALPLWLMLHANAALFAGIQSVFALPLYLICFRHFNAGGANDLYWAYGAFTLSATFIVLTSMAIRLFKDYPLRDKVMATYAFTASAFISIGFAIGLPAHYLPLAFACQILATMLVYRAISMAFLKKIAIILMGVFVFIKFKMFSLLCAHITLSLTGDVSYSAPDIATNTAFDLLVPAILMGAAYIVFRKRGAMEDTVSKEDMILKKGLLALSSVLALTFAYISIRQLFHPGVNIFTVEAGFMERAAVTCMVLAIAAALWVLDRARGWIGMKEGAVIFASIALSRLAYFDLLLHNPYLDSSQFIGDIPALHGATWVYGAGLVLSFYLANSAASVRPTLATMLRSLGVVFLFMLTSVNVTQFFHGGNIADKIVLDTELYLYSIVWLLTGLALLGIGIVKGSKVARLASLCFILLTVGKVFLIDASELKDLYRVFSFLGLGASLIGLSFFYSRFVFTSKDRPSGGI